MKSLNILMMAVLMVGMGSNLIAAPTITNTSNEIIGVQFYDQNKNKLLLVNANNKQNKDTKDTPGLLDHRDGWNSMNIPINAASVDISLTTSYLIDTTKPRTHLDNISSSKSYFIIGCDPNPKSPQKAWSIVDTDTYYGPNFDKCECTRK